MQVSIYLAIQILIPLSLFAAALLRSQAKRKEQQQKIRSAGCLPVRKYPHTGTDGQDLALLRQQAAKEGRFSSLRLELVEKYGTTFQERTPGGGWRINTAETENFQAVLATQFNIFEKSPTIINAISTIWGQGILTLHAGPWRHTRQLVTPLFKRTELDEVQRFEKFVDRMIAFIPPDGGTVDMQPLLQKLFMDSATEFVFGDSIDCLRDDTGRANGIRNAFDKLLLETNVLARQSRWTRFKALLTGAKPWRKDADELFSYVDGCIAKYAWGKRDIQRSEQDQVKAKDQAGGKQDQGGEKERYVLLDGMSRAISDPVELRYNLLQVLIPAHETTATVLSRGLFLLARHPDTWQRLRQEAVKLGDQPLTLNLLNSLDAFKHTVLETIRLLRHVPWVQRVATADTILPRGGGPDNAAPIFVPKGTVVSLDSWPTFQDPEVWGADAALFRPDRFADRPLGWEFTPFIGGPRRCPASQQVLTQAVYLLVRLARQFHTLENRDPSWEFYETPRGHPSSRNGVLVALHTDRPDQRL